MAASTQTDLAIIPPLVQKSVFAQKVSPWNRDLKRGMSGDDVSALQQFLIEVESYPEALVTGYFGPLTQRALQTFQREQNINPASGYFGTLTKNRAREIIRLQGISM